MVLYAGLGSVEAPSQCYDDADDLLKEQNVGKGFIIGTGDRGWEAVFPVHVTPIQFQQGVCGHSTSTTAIHQDGLVDDPIYLGVLRCCQEGVARPFWNAVLVITGLSV